MIQSLEVIFTFLDNKSGILYGFAMLGVLLVLVGIQNVTRKDLKAYFKNRTYLKRADHIIAWGIFYIIFGILISIASVLTVTLYL